MPASSPRSRARPGSGRAVRRKKSPRRVPGPKRPERVLSGRRARRALGQLARRGGLGIAGEPSSGAARRGVRGLGACSRSAYVPRPCVPRPSVRSARLRGVCRRGQCSRNPCSQSACSQSPCGVRGAARSAELRQSAVRAPRPRAGRELRARVCPRNGWCAGAHGPPSPAKRLEPRPCRPYRWPAASPLHPCRCLKARPGSTTRPSQRRQSRRPEIQCAARHGRRRAFATAVNAATRTGGLVHAR